MHSLTAISQDTHLANAFAENPNVSLLFVIYKAEREPT
jgi:hypothetical protein